MRFGWYCLLCCAPAVLASMTLLICNRISTHDQYNRFPDWVFSPFISFTGVHYPECVVYQIGLTCAGISLIVFNQCVVKPIVSTYITFDVFLESVQPWLLVPVVQHWLPFIPTPTPTLAANHASAVNSMLKNVHRMLLWIVNHLLIAASVLVTVQAFINVNPSMIPTMLSRDVQSMPWDWKWYSDWNSCVHIIAALIFFTLIFWHNLWIVIGMYLFFGNNTHRTSNQSSYSNRYYISFFVKLLLVLIELVFALFLFCDFVYLMFVLDLELDLDLDAFASAERGRREQEHEQEQEQDWYLHLLLNMLGVCQWMVTASYCVFWMSFVVDYAAFQNKHILVETHRHKQGNHANEKKKQA